MGIELKKAFSYINSSSVFYSLAISHPCLNQCAFFTAI